MYTHPNINHAHAIVKNGKQPDTYSSKLHVYTLYMYTDGGLMLLDLRVPGMLSFHYSLLFMSTVVTNYTCSYV